MKYSKFNFFSIVYNIDSIYCCSKEMIKKIKKEKKCNSLKFLIKLHITTKIKEIFIIINPIIL